MALRRSPESVRHHGLLGREADIEQVVAFVQSALLDGGALMLSGEPGIGKSALLDLAADVAVSAGARLLRTAGVESDGAVGRAALGRLLAPLRDDIERLPRSSREALSIGSGAGVGSPSARLLLGSAVLELLARSGSVRPLFVVIDDLHRLDSASAEVLAFVVRRLPGLPAGFLGAIGLEGDTRLAGAGLRELPLRPLDERSAEALVARRSPGLAPMVRRRVVTEARGNPLALIELASSLTIRQRSGVDPLPPALPAGPPLARRFAHRLGELTPHARNLLLLAALGDPGEPAVLEAAADLPGGLDHLAAAEQLRLVAVDGRDGVIAFRHPLVRAALVETSSEAERRRAHLAWAEALVGRPERRARHLAEAAVRPDEEVAGPLEEAARGSLRRGDASSAVHALTRAAELSPERSDRGRRLVEAAYVAATITGQVSSASHLLDAARAAAPGAGESLRAATAAANLMLNSGCDVDSAHRLLLGAILRHVGPVSSQDEVLVDALHGLLTICSYAGRAELWKPLDDVLARVTPEPPVALALSAVRFVEPAHRDDVAIQRLEEAIASLHTEVDPVVVERVAVASTRVDRVGGCRQALRRVVRDAQQGGATALSLSALLSVCLDDWCTGRWDEALALVDRGVALSRTLGNQRFEEMLGGYVRPLVLVARGRYEDGLVPTERLAEWGASRGAAMATTSARHVRALAAMSRGSFEEAYRQASTISRPGTLPPHTPQALWVLLDLVESAVRTGRGAEAAAHVAAVRAADVANLSPRLALVATGCAALAARGDHAAGLYEQAVSVPGADRWPFELARVHLAYGEHLRRARAAEGARRHLVAALGLFERLGAVPWMARAADEVRAMGQATSGPGRGSAAALLTPQELEIAHLAASGLTNRQIAARLYLSHRTVGAHLYKVYPKLGITSRAALRDALGSPG